MTRRILLFAVFTVLAFFLGSRYLPNNEWDFWGLILYTLLVIVPQVALFPAIRRLGYKHDKSPCLRNSNQCCVEAFKREMILEYGKELIIGDRIIADYRLVSYEDMINKVDSFVSKNSEIIKESYADLIKSNLTDKQLKSLCREIWVFSHDVSNESFLSKIQLRPSVHDNKEIKFVYFYMRSDSETDREMQNIEDVEPTRQVDWMKIETATGSEDEINILPDMLDSVIFVFRTRKAISFACFFALKGQTGDAVYFRMPYCMNEDYYGYFNKLRGDDES